MTGRAAWPGAYSAVQLQPAVQRGDGGPLPHPAAGEAAGGAAGNGIMRQLHKCDSRYPAADSALTPRPDPSKVGPAASVSKLEVGS